MRNKKMIPRLRLRGKTQRGMTRMGTPFTRHCRQVGRQSTHDIVASRTLVIITSPYFHFVSHNLYIANSKIWIGLPIQPWMQYIRCDGFIRPLHFRAFGLYPKTFPRLFGNLTSKLPVSPACAPPQCSGRAGNTAGWEGSGEGSVAYILARSFKPFLFSVI